MSIKRVQQCCAPWCYSNSNCETKNISYFRFPRDEARCIEWKKNVGNLKWENYTAEQCYNRLRLCGLHFPDSMFSSMQKNRLHNYAVPIIFSKGVTKNDWKENFDHNSMPSTSQVNTDAPVTPVKLVNSAHESHPPSLPMSPPHYSDAAAQTPPMLTYNSPRKAALRNKVRRLNRRLTTQPTQPKISMEGVGSFLAENYTSNFANFVKAQMEFMKKSPKGSRYTNEYKQFALTIYFLGPKVYKFLKKTFKLPSKSTLFRITSNWEVKEGFDDFVFSAIKIKVSILKEDAKDCVLCVDEMSLKTNLFYNISHDEIIGFHHSYNQKSLKPATEALVFMARGLNANWKQPIAYFFVASSCPANDLQAILFECIIRLKNIGLNVLATITDQGPNFYKLFRKLKVTVKEPYFYVDNSKIFCMFDTPHLLKSTRNNLFCYKFHYAKGVTSKSHLETFYNEDKKRSFRMAPRLTDDHIYPTNPHSIFKGL